MNQDAIEYIKTYVEICADRQYSDDFPIDKIPCWIQEAFDKYNSRQYEGHLNLRKLGFYTFEEWAAMVKKENEMDNN